MKKKNLLNGRKGNAFTDSLSVVIVLFVFGVISMISYNILTEVNTDIQNSELANQTKQEMSTLQANFPSWMDLAFLTALILLWVVAIVMSFLVDSHPIFLVITLILIIFVLFFASIMGNTYEELSAESELDTNSFPITNFILKNLVLVVVFIGFSIMLALYGKNRLSG